MPQKTQSNEKGNERDKMTVHTRSGTFAERSDNRSRSKYHLVYNFVHITVVVVCHQFEEEGVERSIRATPHFVEGGS